jgi:hypothetical protein
MWSTGCSEATPSSNRCCLGLRSTCHKAVIALFEQPYYNHPRPISHDRLCIPFADKSERAVCRRILTRLLSSVQQFEIYALSHGGVARIIGV